MPLTIDGTSVSSVTIDGEEVKQITVDGDNVFITDEIKLETNSVGLSGSIDDGVSETVSFSEEFGSTPAVVTYIDTRGGGESIQCRAKNVSKTAFEVHMEEPDDEGHAAETVNWIAAIPGSYIIDGTMIEAAIHSTSTVRDNTNGSTFGDTISFGQAWQAAPAVIHNLQTYNNGEFMATQANSVSSSDFNLSQEALDTGHESNAVIEDIGWISFEDVGATSIDGNAVDTSYAADGSNDGVDDTPHTITYSASFASTPDVIISQNTMSGTDGGYARASGTQDNTTGHEVYAEEDQVVDSERSHADETFGWFAMDPASVVKDSPLITEITNDFESHDRTSPSGAWNDETVLRDDGTTIDGFVNNSDFEGNWWRNLGGDGGGTDRGYQRKSPKKIREASIIMRVDQTDDENSDEVKFHLVGSGQDETGRNTGFARGELQCDGPIQINGTTVGDWGGSPQGVEYRFEFSNINYSDEVLSYRVVKNATDNLVAEGTDTFRQSANDMEWFTFGMTHGGVSGTVEGGYDNLIVKG